MMRERKSIFLDVDVYENAKKIAHMQQTSISDVIRVLLNEYVQDNDVLLQKYNEIFGNRK